MKFAYGADMGFLFTFNEQLRLSSFYEQRFHPWEETTSKNELRWMNHNQGVGIFYNIQTKFGFADFGINYMVYLR